ncbi:MAG TPA: DUF5615 family PIN-like protein [Longimicrobiaceae bacterium]|nr:DUF5615 family PIN-like protein [Longimicrobiaceae bacterium]
MFKLAADENFKEQIVNGLRRRLRDLDITTAQEAGLRGSSDPEILERAAAEGRVLLTHDTRTMKGFAYARVEVGAPMPGVVEVPDLMPISEAIRDLILVAELLEPEEIRDRVLRLPL